MAFNPDIVLGNKAAAVFTPPTGNTTFTLIQSEDKNLGVVRANAAVVGPNRELFRIKSNTREATPKDPKSLRVFSRNVVTSFHVWDTTTSQLVVVSLSTLLTMPEHALITNAKVGDLVAYQRNFWGVDANLNQLILGGV